MMSRGNRLRMIERAVYRLKRGFGQPLRIIRQDSDNYDLTTGKTTVVKSVVQLKRAIVQTGQSDKQFIYDIGYLKANSNFTYGGFFTDTIRKVIIDIRDLPCDFKITATESFYIVFQGGRYEIKQVNYETYALFIVMEKVTGAPVYDVHVANVVDTLEIDEYLSSNPGTQVIYRSFQDDLEITDNFSDGEADPASVELTEHMAFTETVVLESNGTSTTTNGSNSISETSTPQVRHVIDYLRFDENAEAVYE